MKDARIALIREAATKSADDGVAWRKRMERWLDLTIVINLNITTYETNFGKISIVPDPFFRIQRHEH